MIVIGRVEIDFDTYAMRRFNMLLSEGHLKTTERIIAYSNTFPKRRRIVGIKYPSHST
jgi:hypothetical protein